MNWIVIMAMALILTSCSNEEAHTSYRVKLDENTLYDDAFFLVGRGADRVMDLVVWTTYSDTATVYDLHSGQMASRCKRVATSTHGGGPISGIWYDDHSATYYVMSNKSMTLIRYNCSFQYISTQSLQPCTDTYGNPYGIAIPFVVQNNTLYCAISASAALPQYMDYPCVGRYDIARQAWTTVSSYPLDMRNTDPCFYFPFIVSDPSNVLSPLLVSFRSSLSFEYITNGTRSYSSSIKGVSDYRFPRIQGQQSAIEEQQTLVTHPRVLQVYRWKDRLAFMIYKGQPLRSREGELNDVARGPVDICYTTLQGELLSRYTYDSGEIDSREQYSSQLDNTIYAIIRDSTHNGQAHLTIKPLFLIDSSDS